MASRVIGTGASLSIKLFLFFWLCFHGCCTQSFTPMDTIVLGQPLSGNKTIVSKGGIFELGFFTPGNSKRFYVGTWYKKRPERTVVWVANRERPVPNSSLTEFKITGDGNLAIVDDSNTSIWSSNLNFTAPKSTAARLLDSGNLVLINSSDPSVFLWQSFENPTDTWLPGARLGWNRRTRKNVALVSWKSLDDPAPGYYSYGMDPEGSDQLMQIWNGTQVYWASGEWNGQYFSSVPEMTRNKVYNYTYSMAEKYLNYTLFDTQIITRLVADISGEGKQWAWVNMSAEWTLVWSQPRLQCLVYSFCGPFSICSENGVPICSCLAGFKPASKLAWDSQIWGGGCARKSRLQCGNSSDGIEKDEFLSMPNVVLPSNSDDSELISVEDHCEASCFNSCSCVAYALVGNGCRIWKGELRNLKSAIDGFGNDDALVGTLFLRLAATELKVSSRSSSKSHKHEVIGITIGVVGSVLVILAFILILARRFRSKKLVELFARNEKESSVRMFRYSTLQRLTKNFSERLGGGGFGSVYKGMLPDSSAIAVKKLESCGQGEKEFRAEVTTMGRTQHVNLLRLRGFCCEGQKRLIVYDYMQKGSLDSHLFSKSSPILSWNDRYKIAIGTARGLAYLHEQCRECIIHCDIKPENILLDDNLNPKVADFGLAKLMGRDISRVLTTMRGTIGYLAPEWISGMPITPKADVYSFGMLLFELISGRRNMTQCYGDDDVGDGNGDGIGFFPIAAAKKLADGEALIDLLDEKLEGNADIGDLDRACRVACWCIQDQEMDRLSMGQVVQILEGVTEVVMPPIPENLKHIVSGTQ